MAAARSVAGILREVWTEAAGQAIGAQPITTNIEMTTPKLGSVRAIIVVGTTVGTPTVAGACTIVNRKLVVTVTVGGAAGSTANWTLDVQRLHSISQANNGSATVLVVDGPNTGGGLAETFAQTYDVGSTQAHQTATLTDAHGSGLILNAASGAFTGATALTIPTNINGGRLDLEMWGVNAFDQTLQFSKNRAAYGAADVALVTADPLGKIDWYGYITGEANTFLARIEAVYDAARAEINSHLDFHVAHNAAAVLSWSMIGEAAASDLVGYTVGGIFPRIYPEDTGTGSLGLLGNAWNTAYIHQIGMGIDPAAGTAYSVTMVFGGHPEDLTPDNSAVIYASDHASGTCFAVAAEAAITGVPAAANSGIPMYYNGVRYLVHAVATP